MARIPALVDNVLSDIAAIEANGWIPPIIINHRGDKDLRPYARESNFVDYSNWSGSITMFLLLWPTEHGIECQTASAISPGFTFLRCVDPSGERAEILKNPGPIIQHSGEGPNNYRNHLACGRLFSSDSMQRSESRCD